MAWLESHQSLREHPKSRKLARVLDLSIPTTIGHLHCLWWWAMDYSDDGSLRQFDDLDIAIGGEWEGDPSAFVSALVTVGFLDRDDDGGTSVHDWEDYGGKLTSRRKANAERMRVARAERDTKTKKTRATHVQRTQRARAGLHNKHNTTQQTEQEGNAPGADAPQPKKRAHGVPADFAVSDTLAAWGEKEGFTQSQMVGQVPQFVDHFTAKGETRKDWDASFRTWMRNAEAYGHLARKADGSLRIVGEGFDALSTTTPEAHAEYLRQLDIAKKREDKITDDIWDRQKREAQAS